MDVPVIPLTGKCRDRLRDFTTSCLRTIDLDTYLTLFKCFPIDHITKYEHFTDLLDKWGGIAYNHLYISLTVSVPWIRYYWNVPFPNFTSQSQALSYNDSEHNIFRYVWIRGRDNVLLHTSPAFYLDIWSCVSAGYGASQDYDLGVESDEFCWLGVETYDSSICHTLKPVHLPCKGFEMPCSEGRVRFTDHETGLTIERTTHMYDFVYNEYIVLQTHKYIYSECEELQVVLDEYLENNHHFLM